jgi:E3 ubiquitin-protein ligase MARCH6
LSSVPFDLLFLHLVVPPTVKRLKLDKRAKKLWLKYWIMSTEAFCLSGLLRFTVRDWKVKEETGPRALERLWPILHPIVRFCFGPYRLEATQARVPAADTVAVLPLAERRKGGVFIPLNEWGAPKTPEDKMRLLKQDRRARQLHRDPKYDYDVVWLPKYWQTRIYAYIFTTIAAVATVISLCFFVPLILGRFVLDPFGKNPLHDGYNFVSHQSIVICADCLDRRGVSLHIVGLGKRPSGQARVALDECRSDPPLKALSPGETIYAQVCPQGLNAGPLVRRDSDRLWNRVRAIHCSAR